MKKPRNRLWGVVLNILLTLVVIPPAPNCFAAEKNGSPLSAGRPSERIYMVGHRGAAGLAPENTLAAFKKACEIGVDAIELDVLLTADNKVVVHHDYALKPETTRTPDGEWLSRPGPLIPLLPVLI